MNCRRQLPASCLPTRCLQPAALQPPAPPTFAGPALSIPLASWLLCESLIRWAGAWQQPEIDAATDALQRTIVAAADGGGMHGQAYWLACSLAAGGLLKFRTIGRREGGHLLRLGETEKQSGQLACPAPHLPAACACICVCCLSLLLLLHLACCSCLGYPPRHACCPPTNSNLTCPLYPAGDSLINCQPVHAALGDSIADMLPVNVGVSG